MLLSFSGTLAVGLVGAVRDRQKLAAIVAVAVAGIFFLFCIVAGGIRFFC